MSTLRYMSVRQLLDSVSVYVHETCMATGESYAQTASKKHPQKQFTKIRDMCKV